MNCPNCRQPTEEGAAFCGNCGEQLRPTLQASPLEQAFTKHDGVKGYGRALAPFAVAGSQGTIPAYALATPAQHTGETKAVLAIALGIIGSLAAVFAAAAGLGLGIAGIVLGTMGRQSRHRRMATVGIVISSLAVAASLAVWVYLVVHDGRLQQTNAQAQAGTSSPAIAANGVSTACYSTGFSSQLNVSTSDKNCDMEAYDGTTLESSGNAYKVYGYTQPALNETNFSSFAKAALEKDIQDNLSGFTVTRESVGLFASSPAYVINASSAANNVAYVEAAVLHKSSSGTNVFVFVHATAGSTTDLHDIETEWQWK